MVGWYSAADQPQLRHQIEVSHYQRQRPNMTAVLSNRMLNSDNEANLQRGTASEISLY